MRKDASKASIGETSIPTPTKRTPAKATGSRKRGSKGADDSNGTPVDDEEAYKTQSKKRKRSTIKNSIVMKQEQTCVELSDEGFGSGSGEAKLKLEDLDDFTSNSVIDEDGDQ